MGVLPSCDGAGIGVIRRSETIRKDETLAERRVSPEMRRMLLLGLCLCLLIPPGAWSATDRGSRPESASAEQYPRICLELMELEAPESGSGSQMELPPLKGMEEAPAPPKSPAPVQKETRKKKADKPVPAETRKSGIPTAGAIAPGLEPLPMRGPSVGVPRSEALTEEGRVPASLPSAEITEQLKEVPAPDASPQKLRRLPPADDEDAAGRAQEPDMPLLGDVPKATGTSSSTEQGLHMPLKPSGESVSRKEMDVDSQTLLQSDSPEKYLEHREEIDTDLIRIYKRFYKNRRR